MKKLILIPVIAMSSHSFAANMCANLFHANAKPLYQVTADQFVSEAAPHGMIDYVMRRLKEAQEPGLTREQFNDILSEVAIEGVRLTRTTDKISLSLQEINVVHELLRIESDPVKKFAVANKIVSLALQSRVNDPAASQHALLVIKLITSTSLDTHVIRSKESDLPSVPAQNIIAIAEKLASIKGSQQYVNKFFDRYTYYIILNTGVARAVELAQRDTFEKFSDPKPELVSVKEIKDMLKADMTNKPAVAQTPADTKATLALLLAVEPNARKQEALKEQMSRLEQATKSSDAKTAAKAKLSLEFIAAISNKSTYFSKTTDAGRNLSPLKIVAVAERLSSVLDALPEYSSKFSVEFKRQTSVGTPLPNAIYVANFVSFRNLTDTVRWHNPLFNIDIADILNNPSL